VLKEKEGSGLVGVINDDEASDEEGGEDDDE